MGEELIYSKTITKEAKTITKESNDCFITKNAHVVEVHNMSTGSIVGYVATCSFIYKEWMRCSESFVYDNKEEAIAFCEEHFKGEEVSE